MFKFIGNNNNNMVLLRYTINDSVNIARYNAGKQFYLYVL